MRQKFVEVERIKAGIVMQKENKDFVAYRESEEYKRLKEIRRKKRRKQVLIARICVFSGAALVILVVALLVHALIPGGKDVETAGKPANILKEETYLVIEKKPDIDVQLLTPNDYSRPGIATETIKNIVVHYTANPGTTAQQNRDFFESLKDTHDNSVSSHFVVGLDGEIIQCIPTAERAYASNQRNYNTVSIECCHMDETGKFNDSTYNSVIELCAWLCCKFNLQAEDVIRHYDVTGKCCPKYFVDNPEEWDKFIQDVADYIKDNAVEMTKEERDAYYGEGESEPEAVTEENSENNDQ